MSKQLIRGAEEDVIGRDSELALYSKLLCTPSSTRKPLLTGVFFACSLLFVLLSCTVIHSPLIAIAGLTVLAITIFLLQRPQLVMLFVFLGAGLPSLQVPLPGHTVRPVEAGLALCLVLIFLQRPRLYIKLPHILVFIFFAITIISFIHVPEISNSSSIFGANKRVYDLVVIFLALFCGTFLAGNVKNASSFLVGVLLTNIPLYIIALLQALRVTLPTLLSPNQDPATTGDAGRLVGPFDGAAAFGIYLTGLFAIALVCWLLGTSRRDRRIGLLMLIINVAALVGSGTRSALIATGAMLIVGLIITGRSKLLFWCVLIAGAGLLAFSSIIIGHFTHAATSTSNRLFVWGVAWQLIQANPWIGIGLEQFHYYYDRLIISESTQLNQHGISVHNQYLEWAMESGIFALLTAVAFLSSIITFCLRAYRGSSCEQRMFLLASLLLTVAVVITSFLDVPLDDVEGGVFLCMLAGLTIGVTIQDRRVPYGVAKI